MVDADDTTDALKKSQPSPRDGLTMCNWYAVPLMEPMKLEPSPSKTSYLSKVQSEVPKEPNPS